MRIISRALLSLTAVTFGGSAAVAQLSFTEVAQSVGVHYEFQREAYVGVGSGGAWLDYDGDGWVDLYLTQSVGPNHLFRNLGDGTFADVLDAAGAADAAGIGHGAVAGDYDNDGDPDLFVSNNGQNRLYRNERVETGTPTFTDVTAEAGLDNDGLANSQSAAFGDYDNDGWIDLYVTNHTFELRPLPGENLGSPNYLWHNNGDGTFENLAAELGVDNGEPNTREGLFTEPGASFATMWTDFDNDGDVDLIVVNDFGSTIHPNQLFRNDGSDGEDGWVFTDISQESLFDMRVLGMGVGGGDIDNDGDLDYYASHAGPNVMMLNRLDEGLELFDEIAESAGTQSNDPELFGPAMGPISWGSDFADFDLDGWVDLLVTNGWVEFAGDNSASLQPSYIYRNNGDLTFTELHDSAGLTELALSGKTSGFADYDQDGDVDFFMGSVFWWNDADKTAEPSWPRLYRNDNPSGHNHLAILARGTVGNADALGTRITVTTDDMTQIREVGTGTSFLSSPEPTQTFGLGAATEADVHVRWLSGLMLEMRDVDANERLTVVEPVITVTSSLDVSEFSPGATVQLTFDFVNQTGATQMGRPVIVFENDTLSQTIRTGPVITLVTGGTLSNTVPINVPATAPLGSGSFVLRFVDAGGDLIHQSYNDFEIVSE